MDGISIDKLLNLIPIANIIDIRDNYQYILGKIPTAINVPMNFLMVNPENYLNKSDTYYIYCEYGTRSEKLCSNLKNRGYNVINVIGGYNEYKLFVHKTK